jgi:hypothetical protein
MHKYGESITTQITMATVRHVTSGSELRQFHGACFLLDLLDILLVFCWTYWIYCLFSLLNTLHSQPGLVALLHSACDNNDSYLLTAHYLLCLIAFGTFRVTHFTARKGPRVTTAADLTINLNKAVTVTE